MGKKGFTLMAVISSVSIFLLLGVLAGGLGIFQLSFSSQVKEGVRAQYLAEAGISEALYNLNADPEWGKKGETIIKELPGSNSKGYYTITFKQGSTPYSVNNLKGTTAVSGYQGVQVPANSALILSTGISGSKKRMVEVLVNRPAFKYALATSGSLNSADSPLWVAGAKTMEEAIKGNYNTQAYVFANGKGNKAILTGTNTYIAGSIGSAGGIEVKPPSNIQGGVYPYSTPVSLPELNPSQFDPGSIPGTINIDEEAVDKLQVDTLMRKEGNLKVNGPIELSNGILYVAGDLNVEGAVTGRGAVIVEGSATVKKGSELKTANQVALLAKNDVYLDGQYNYFQGLVYTGGNLKADQITILGAFLANSSNPEKGNADFKDAKFIPVTESVEQKVSVNVTKEIHPIAIDNTLETTETKTATSTIDYDFSLQKFISNGNKLRIIYWRNR